MAGYDPRHSIGRAGSDFLFQSAIGADVDITRADEKGRTALHIAAQHGISDSVKVLLNLGAPINVVDKELSTPLHYAARASSADTVLYLLGRNADVHAINNQGKTPLHYAATSLSVNGLSHLLSNGAEIDRTDHDGKTPLYYAFETKAIDNVIKLLLNEATIDVQDKNGVNHLQRVLEPASAEYYDIYSRHQTVVRLQWELPQVLRQARVQQNVSETNSPTLELFENFVLNKEVDGVVKLINCKEFLQTNWEHNDGIIALQILCEALDQILNIEDHQKKENSYQTQGMLEIGSARADTMEKSITLEFAFGRDAANTITEALTWICAAIRPGMEKEAIRSPQKPYMVEELSTRLSSGRRTMLFKSFALQPQTEKTQLSSEDLTIPAETSNVQDVPPSEIPSSEQESVQILKASEKQPKRSKWRRKFRESLHKLRANLK